MITDTMPEQLKLDFALWTTKGVKELIEREFSIVIGRRAIGNYLKSWGFPPQKPKKRAYEQSSKKVNGYKKSIQLLNQSQNRKKQPFIGEMRQALGIAINMGVLMPQKEKLLLTRRFIGLDNKQGN